MKAAFALVFIFFSVVMAEARSETYLVYKPGGSIREQKINDEQIQSLRRQGFIVETNQSVFLLQSKEISGGRLPETGGGGTVEPPVWNLRALRSREANELARGQGENITVCLIDSGANPQHPALVGALKDGRNFIDSQNPQDMSDASGHGTAMATLIAGRAVNGAAVGVAPAAMVSVAKVVDREGRGTLRSLAEGFRWCMERSHIINLSLGFSQKSEIMQDLMGEAYRRGITVIVAAGNDGKAVLPSARESTALAVGSINEKGVISKFSARGVGLDFFAPGENVPVLEMNGNYSLRSGTSLSAALASGVEAIRRSRGSAQLKTRFLGGTREGNIPLIDALETATGSQQRMSRNNQRGGTHALISF